MKSFIFSTSALLISLAMPANADPTFGLGLTLTFGAGQDVDTGIGVRMFSNDEPDEFAASLGLDYMFRKQTLRGSLGAAYLMDNTYLELSGGYAFGGSGFDIGLGFGGVKTNDDDDDDDNDDDDDVVTDDPVAVRPGTDLLAF